MTPTGSISSSSSLAFFAGTPRSSPFAEAQAVNHHLQDREANGNAGPSERRQSEKQTGTSTARRPGACSRCKKLKMKCVFAPENPTCSRCSLGGHQCQVEGRKPRTPGQREFLLKQIREKDETIAKLLSDLTSTTSTPLSINSSRIALNTEERDVHGDVLAWMEKRHSSSSRSIAKACAVFDTSQLEDEDMWSSDEEDDDSSSESVERVKIEPREPPTRVKATRLLSLPDEGAPLGFLAKCSLKYNSGVHTTLPSGTESLFGIASHLYFQPSPCADLDVRRIIVEREMIPEILMSGLITPDEGRILFDIFFEHINPFLSLLDEAIHNAASVLRRCPFLFTVVCAVSSRYYSERPGLYKLAIHFAKASAASAFIDGWKCVEMCQAYIILAAYGVPTQRWEESRSWTYTGIAARIAVELNLNSTSNITPVDERHERELLNRYRTWMICSILDGSLSLEMGKSSVIREDEVIRNSSHWCSSSKFQHPLDADLPVLIELIRIMQRFMDIMQNFDAHALQVIGTTTSRDISNIVDVFEKELRASGERYHRDTQEKLRIGMVSYFLQYCRLMIFSYGFRSETGDTAPVSRPSLYLAPCIDAAFSMLSIWKDHMLTTGHMKYAPDFFFVGTGFAGAFLLKLLHPRFTSILGPDERTRILHLENVLIKLLASDELAVDDQHAPRLYSVFLGGFLNSVLSLWEAPSS
ncbi:hypothetical protein BV25DRAFT_1803108 [Artomyces pyxidatus]|uniref:Uncharacterized protein n=1 Tax=Artomyces pyxidatus TaxID=48021 RepID=A0ACB8T4P5_9AGAM|nr:hypothetical protein BV25DRAFT_1803108 [Artomyces pyxidatus]